MRVLNTLPQEDLRLTAASAAASEAAGYDGLLTMENKHDPFLAHAIAAVNTHRVELGTSVAIAFSRSPTRACKPVGFVPACADFRLTGRG